MIESVILGSGSWSNTRMQWTVCVLGVLITIITVASLILASVAYIKATNCGQCAEKEGSMLQANVQIQNTTSTVPAVDDAGTGYC